MRAKRPEMRVRAAGATAGAELPRVAPPPRISCINRGITDVFCRFRNKVYEIFNHIPRLVPSSDYEHISKMRGKCQSRLALRGGKTGLLPRLSSKLLNGLSRRSGNARTVARPIFPPSAPRQAASSSQPCLGGRLWLRAKPLLRREGRSASRASPSLLRPALEKTTESMRN